MTALATNTPRTFEIGSRNEFGMTDNVKAYEGSAISIVPGTGYARQLAAGDRFAGFAEAAADNTITGHTAGGVNVRVIESGKIQLSVSGAVITDVGQPVYATDDNTFVFSPVSSVFVGFVHRFVSSGVVVVAFDALNYRDPYGDRTSRATISADTTLDETYTGKLLWVDTDAKIITLPAVATGLDGVQIVNGGSFGTVAVNISPAAADSIFGPGVTSADNKDLINTKATAQRGDFAVIGGNDADGYGVQALRGTWAREA